MECVVEIYLFVCMSQKPESIPTNPSQRSLHIETTLLVSRLLPKLHSSRVLRRLHSHLAYLHVWERRRRVVAAASIWTVKAHIADLEHVEAEVHHRLRRTVRKPAIRHVRPHVVLQQLLNGAANISSVVVELQFPAGRCSVDRAQSVACEGNLLSSFDKPPGAL